MTVAANHLLSMSDKLFDAPSPTHYKRARRKPPLYHRLLLIFFAAVLCALVADFAAQHRAARSRTNSSPHLHPTRGRRRNANRNGRLVRHSAAARAHRDTKLARKCIREAFRAVGSQLDSVEMSRSAYSARALLVAAVDPSYPYGDMWLNERQRDGIPFVLFRVSEVRHGDLGPHWARLPALLATQECFDAKDVVYSDVDTLLYWPEVLKFASANPQYPVIASAENINDGNDPVVYTDVLVLRPHQAATHLLNGWYYSGSDQDDQRSFNQLFVQRSWFRNIVHVVHRNLFKKFELHHCDSSRTDRATCLAHMHRWSVNARRRMEAQAVWW